MKKIVLFLILIFGINLIQAQNGKIAFKETSIQLDGKLNESVWETLPMESNFFNYIPNSGENAQNNTQVKLFHNGKFLYISAIYQDPNPEVQIGSLKRDDIRNSGGNSDSFAVVIDTYNQQQAGYFFIVNMGDALVDALVARRGNGFRVNTNWNSTWNAKTSVNGNSKVYEIEIPLKTLGYKTENPNWGIMFHTRNIKLNEWTTSTKIDRNYSQFDLRFAKVFEMENLVENKSSRFVVTPSLTLNHQEDLANETKESTLKPSVDVQYNLNSSLKLDATINPDFSQVDVDRQVTNLSRFSIFFPERRNFFLENSDLFNNLGIYDVNPFYSRKIGAETDMLFGLKLSGNIAEKTRIGILNASTKEEDDIPAQNYTVLVGQQQLSNSFRATGFLINRQEMDGFSFADDYNRVGGLNLNYNSKNNRWTGLINLAQSFTKNISGDNNFYNLGIWYNSLKVSWRAAVRKVEKNYITDVGFVPRLYNYDAITETTIRDGYTQASTRFGLTRFPKNSKIIDNHRYFNISNNTYWDEKGILTQSSTNFNNDIYFKDLSNLYGGASLHHINLQYAFDPLRNGNFITPEVYNFYRMSLGFDSTRKKKFQYGGNVQLGTYYSGKRTRFILYSEYQLLPLARLQVRYEQNDIDLNELGKDTFHLARFIGEIFFTNRLNWTTYVQYNTQFDNFNVNSRLQWEYRPLSYVYLVVSDNYDENIYRKNWGVAFKVNYRLDI
ncbi:DUF5916 domain-containing protein [Aureivirga marina]|uniref:DUF5916 domain-containing protein n=1 Tax=Aureivirga marina TaxID=1182451 RepID=UPI0018CA7CFE|nr:DUF5916 domain-containing protein [Aureivirga marina]